MPASRGLAPELMVMGIGVGSLEAALVEEKRVSGERGATSGPPPFATALVYYEHARHASFGKTKREAVSVCWFWHLGQK